MSSSAGFLPAEPPPEPVWLAVFRQRDDKVRFLELNPVTAQLLERIGDNAAHETGAALLRGLAQDIAYEDETRFLAHGRDILGEMRDAGLVIRTRKGSNR